MVATLFLNLAKIDGVFAITIDELILLGCPRTKENEKHLSQQTTLKRYMPFL